MNVYLDCPGLPPGKGKLPLDMPHVPDVGEVLDLTFHSKDDSADYLSVVVTRRRWTYVHVEGVTDRPFVTLHCKARP